MLRERQRTGNAFLVGAIMQMNDFHPGDLFGQIQSLVEQLEKEREARAMAEVAGAATSNLLSIVGKELQPPLESVAAMADRILAGPLSARQRHEAEALARSTRILLSALTEVVDFSNLESGEAELSLDRFDLHALVNQTASVLQRRAGAKGLTSGVDMAANCPRFIVGDEVRVRQVLMGLIDTALWSTFEGSIRLFVSVNDAGYPITVRFDVADTGTGLSPAERVALFQPAAEPSRVGGRLGLPIARRLAEAMGGGVGCDSAIGQGSLYWFTFQTVVADDIVEDQDTVTVLDAANDDAPVDGPKPETKPKPAAKGALAGHVLVVEGNTVNRLLIGAYLEEFGLTYEVVETGTAALMCLAARSYDLVLMDTALPDYDGLQMAQRIRAMQALSSEVPIVAVAAASDKDDGRALVEAGVNARVAKPIQGRALYAALVPFLPMQRGGVPVQLAS
jgi:signal transduction histidine kinase